MQAKKYRLQKDSLRTINASVAFFIKLLAKTCEVVQSTSSAASTSKRSANTLDIDHLARAIKRYDVLRFLSDLINEMNQRHSEVEALESVDRVLEAADSTVAKRKTVVEADEEAIDAQKKQRSITSFFTRS